MFEGPEVGMPTSSSDGLIPKIDPRLEEVSNIQPPKTIPEITNISDIDAFLKEQEKRDEKKKLPRYH
jgi:hypothetical protein